ncbi:MAG: phosphohydrolase [Porphyromonadaceae bacterium CG2_30_38_12]|nr:MAG: phosphohydrolase [Porphyromonadaceae bacterium CG2_30_38_12]
MSNENLINDTIHFVKQQLAGAEGGHDWWHIERVWKLARRIAATEQADILVVELGALLHDIADAKFHNGDETVGPTLAKEFLASQELSETIIQQIIAIIEHVSFKGGTENQLFRSKELDIVQDADRLDAIGAIGIARTFNYGGFRNREIYNPSIHPTLNMNKDEYRNSSAPTINHFYEKLLLLKYRMNTITAQIIAEHRHSYMENFLAEFYKEWDGEL